MHAADMNTCLTSSMAGSAGLNSFLASMAGLYMSPHDPIPSSPPPPPPSTHVSHSREGPPWLEPFLSCSYFDPCLEHIFNKNEKNHFCIDCGEGPLCSRGLHTSHAKHRTLQVRKASHADGVRVENVSKLLDISSIQTYIINNHKIVFLLRQAKGKLTAKPGETGSAGATRHCQICGRLLSDLVKFCSIKCKLIGVRRQLQESNPCGTTLSLSPEARVSPSKSLQFLLESLRSVYKSTARRSTELDLSQFGLTENKRKRSAAPEVAQLETNGAEDIATRVGCSLLSPVSVLHEQATLKPYSLQHAPAALAMATQPAAHVDSVTHGIVLNGAMRTLLAQQCEIDAADHEAHGGMLAVDGAGDETNMRLELALFKRLLMCSKRKRRKGWPHRAPLC